MAKEDKVVLPKIPGRLFCPKSLDKRYGRILILSLLTPFIILILFPYMISDLHSRLGLGFIFFILIFLSMGLDIDREKRFRRWSKRVVFADVTETTVSAEFGDGRCAKNDDLENYILIIEKVNSTYRWGYKDGFIPDSSDYSYSVALRKDKDCFYGYMGDEEGRFGESQPDIFVGSMFGCPKHLKEWVESFQSQIYKPLPIVFPSPEIESDYNTGIYRSAEKL